MSDNESSRNYGLNDADYAALAQFRRAIRAFLNFSERAARDCGLAPQQHQAILAIRGFGSAGEMTVGNLAEHLMIQHNTAVELINRLQSAGLVDRSIDSDDRRRVTIRLTEKANELLERLSTAHIVELRRSGKELADILGQFYQ